MSSTPRRPRLFLAILLAQLLVSLDSTIVNIALPRMQDGLSLTDDARQWVITSFTLMFGVALLFGGRVVDLLGSVRTLYGGLALIGLTSLGGALADNAAEILAARLGQGLAAALIAPATISLIPLLFTETKARARAFGLFNAVMGAGAGVGLLVGGLLAEYAGWRWCLAINIPLAVAAAAVLVASRRSAALPAVTSPRTGPADWLSLVVMGAGFGLLVYALDRTAVRDWHSPQVLVPAAVGAVLLVAFGLAEARRSPAATLPWGVVGQRGRVAALLGVGLAQGGLLSALVFLTFQLQNYMGFGPVATGVAVLPLVVAVILGSMGLAARLAPRVGGRVLITAGLALLGCGTLVFVFLPVSASYPVHILPAVVLIGLGLGVTLTTTAQLAIGGVAGGQLGVISAVRTAAQQLGGSVGVALSGSVALNASAAFLASRPVTADVAHAAFVHGVTRAALAVTVLLFVGAVVCFVLCGRPVRVATEVRSGVE
jgi:MFS family permease